MSSAARRATAVLAAVTLTVAGCAGTPPPAPTTAAEPPATTAHPPPHPAASADRDLATDPAVIADDLVADEQTLRDPASPEEVLTAAAHRQQAAYRTLGRHPEWAAVARPRIPPPLLEGFDRNIDAHRQLGALEKGSAAAADLPAWRIVEPAPAEELLGYYREAAAASGVDWTHLAAINLIETRFGRITGVSTAGAQGPMQFLPSTFAAHGDGGDIRSPRDSIMAAGRFLAAQGYAGDRDNALYRYNNSPHYVQAVNDYAAVLAADPGALAGYYRWQVYVNTIAGDVLLPAGYSATGRVPVRISGASADVLQRMLAAEAGAAPADPSVHSERVSRQFLGTPYGANTLVGSDAEAEELVVDLERVDCFTYADYVEALKRAHPRERFVDALIRVRYKDGIVGFQTRKHFFTDWSVATPAVATDVTASLSDRAVQTAKNLNRKDSGGTYLPGLPMTPRTVTYLPSDTIDAGVLGRLRTGDYIGAYAADGGLDVTHVGIFIDGPDGPVFRNASSSAETHRVMDSPLLDYVRTVPGIVVLRPVQ